MGMPWGCHGDAMGMPGPLGGPLTRHCPLPPGSQHITRLYDWPPVSEVETISGFSLGVEAPLGGLGLIRVRFLVAVGIELGMRSRRG